MQLFGANFSFEATSFFEAEGNIPKIGQTFIVINPDFLAGSNYYFDRLEILISEMMLDDGVRLPGARREMLLKRSIAEGVEVLESMLEHLKSA